MKNYAIFFKKHNLIVLLLFVIGLINSQLFAETPNLEHAKHFAETFFKTNAPQFAPGKAVKAPVLEQRYQSPANKRTQVFAFQNVENGFAIVAQSNGKFAVVGYSPKGEFKKDNLPPMLNTLLKQFEDSLEIIGEPLQKSLTAIAVVEPLLDAKGISLNQFSHEYAGGCPTGCVATAFAQIMAYHKFPDKGVGSHCYTEPLYGKLCVDFENTTYNWNNPSEEDYYKLSSHVGIAMDMIYCESSFGSIPSANDYVFTLQKYFNYHVLTKNSTIKNELDHQRPVYIELLGDPVGHAAVVDGYDSDGWYHLNFGWGGSFNGYYPLYGGTSFRAGIKFINNPTPVFVSRTASFINKSDSLILVKVHEAFNGKTSWNLNTPVYSWDHVDVLNGRVTGLYLRNEYFSSTCYIPKEIGGLTELTTLNLEDFFTGTLPLEIYNLKKLKNLQVIDRNFNGDFTFTLTPGIGTLTDLETVYLNKATGTLPASIGNLKKLKNLWISDGNLTGTIPAEIGNLNELENLRLQDNKLSGNIPAAIGNLSKLGDLNLRGNQLTGIIPASIGTLSKLWTLDLSHNLLTEIENGEWNNPKLSFLYLSDNKIEGALPASFKNLSELIRIEIQNNKISSLPTEMGLWSKLKYFDADQNKLTTIPDEWRKLTELEHFSANHNEIAKLPDEFSSLGQLKFLLLSNNKLTHFPNSLCLLPNLGKLDLSFNRIERFPTDMAQLPAKELYLQNNEIADSLPLFLMSDSLMHVRLDSNRFAFSHIPKSAALRIPVGYQKETKLLKNKIKVMMGDTVRMDIMKLYPYTLPDDKYYWNVYPVNLKTFDANSMEMNKELKVIIDENTIRNKYYCKIINDNSPEYFWRIYYQGSYHTGSAKCLDYLNSETISFELVSELEKYADKYGVTEIVSSKDIPSKIVEDKTVTLLPPMKVRGALKWQASADGNTWHDISANMSQNDLKSNLVSANPSELILSPKTSAYYRYSVQDINCEPLYSDTIKVNPFGKVLYDETINVTTASKTIQVDSMEVTLPKGFYDKDFRLTIAKLDNPPAVADTLKAGVAYDVTVSFGEVFEMPLLIKMKTLNKSTFDANRTQSYKAAYFDEINRKWVMYDKSYVSLQDTTLYFETNHLTKIRTVQDQGKFDRVWEKYNIRVYFKENDEAYINLYKSAKESWHESGAPIMVQDVAHYLAEVMIKFTKSGLPVPQTFSVYIQEMDDDGVVGILGMKNGYLSINRSYGSGFNAAKLRSLLAHEFMHYMQGQHMSPDPGNIFWMEANGHLSDRIVWDESVIPVSESENYLLDGRKAENSIYNFLSNSWDYWNSGFWTQNAFGNINYCYLAGTFLHYMRSYSEAETKLDPVKLLKETTSWSGDSWRQYLSNYIAFSMNSNIGDEYENFVKYVIEGTNKKFTLQRDDNPYGYFIKNSAQDSDNNFANKIFYKFSPEKSEPQTDQINMTLPYLSSKIYMMSNTATDRPVVVTYKPLHDRKRENKVYYGYYDFQNKKMNYVDITDSASYTMLIEQRTEITKKEFRNIAFLLFINKQNPSKSGSESNFEVSFELNAMPVMNIEDIALADVSNRDIHTYSDGSVTSFSLSGRLDFSNVSSYTDLNYKELSYSSNKSLLNDSSYTVTVNFSYHFDQEPVLNDPTGLNIYNMEQIIVYNFKEGKIDIKQKTKITSKIKDWIELPSKNTKPGMTTGVNEEYQHVTFQNLIKPENVSLPNIGEALQFETTTTAETKASVKINSHTIKRTFYNTEGNIDSVTSKNYVSTDYSQEGITSGLFLHYK